MHSVIFSLQGKALPGDSSGNLDDAEVKTLFFQSQDHSFLSLV